MRLLPLLAAFLIATPAAAPAAPLQTVQADPAFTARLGELIAILNGGGDYAAFFTPAFKEKVPKAMFDEVTAQLSAASGKPVAILSAAQETPWRANVRVQYQKAVANVLLVVDPAPPHQVGGLLVRGFESAEKTLPEVERAFAALPGDVGYAIAKLGGGAPQLLAGRNADKPYAIGSAFKLVILAELVRATNAGERKWDDLVTLDGGPLPGGGYSGKPKGTQVSLRELAAQMISISDNSATDILLKALGREKVEAMMPVLGIADPARNRPFLGTLELFKLKGVAGLGERYLKLDEAGRRKLLDGEVAGVPNILIDATSFTRKIPKLIDTFEWFESPNDLVRVMDWLRRNTEGAAGAEARRILSINPGIGPDARGKWQWVGYKGGSEPGVMNMTLLLQARNGDWYVVTGSWNDVQKAVDEGRFASLIGRTAELAAPAP
ncbi:MAG: serine hydrolase [Sphingomonas sp.]|uniref:serine hydrolase n=1 Tax=Sphingomonas sp. TaxID=28214 RepID=UPI0025CEB043|nr:serine hydrolase [Sphingomonas sp.]MBQ1500864.1 serine hydrolase [Sphingomonas sp.]